MRYYIYIVRCEGGSRYTGITTNPHRRMREHVLHLPSGAKYTKSHHVAALDALWSAETRSEASVLEAAIKRLRPEKKRQLIERPERLEEFLGARVDASVYRVEATFSLAPLLAQAGQTPQQR